MQDSNESNLIHFLFGDPSKDRETNIKILNATVNATGYNHYIEEKKSNGTLSAVENKWVIMRFSANPSILGNAWTHHVTTPEIF